MLEFKNWYDGQSKIYIVGYDTPGSSIKTAICLCKTEKQAAEETDRLNTLQQEKAQALIMASEDRAMRLMHPMGNI